MKSVTKFLSVSFSLAVMTLGVSSVVKDVAAEIPTIRCFKCQDIEDGGGQTPAFVMFQNGQCYGCYL